MIALTVQSAAFAQTTTSPNPSASGAMQSGGAVTLVPVGKKGPAGSAVLAQQGNDLQVTLHMPPGYQSTGKASIYSGTCKSNGSAAMTSGKSYPLTLSKTASNAPDMTTLRDLTIESLTSSPHVIVVMGTPALCGDITNLLPPQKP